MAAKKKTREKRSLASTAPAAPVDPAIAECMQLLTRFKELIGPVKTMTGAEVRRSVKLHKGSQFVIDRLRLVCRQHGILQVGSVTLADMEVKWERATALGKVGVWLRAAEKELRDATFQAKRDTWTSALVFYATLQRLGKNDPTLKEAIAEMEGFFKEKRKKKAKPKVRGSG